MTSDANWRETTNAPAAWGPSRNSASRSVVGTEHDGVRTAVRVTRPRYVAEEVHTPGNWGGGQTGLPRGNGLFRGPDASCVPIRLGARRQRAEAHLIGGLMGGLPVRRLAAVAPVEALRIRAPHRPLRPGARGRRQRGGPGARGGIAVRALAGAVGLPLPQAQVLQVRDDTAVRLQQPIDDLVAGHVGVAPERGRQLQPRDVRRAPVPFRGVAAAQLPREGLLELLREGLQLLVEDPQGVALGVVAVVGLFDGVAGPAGGRVHAAVLPCRGKGGWIAPAHVLIRTHPGMCLSMGGGG